MSEEILDALMQFFAILAKQDDGLEDNMIDYVKNFLESQVSREAVDEHMAYFLKKSGANKRKREGETQKEPKLTSVKDSVRVLGLCKKINKKLSQSQKVVVLVRLFELLNAEKSFSEQRMAIINTVAEVFNISKEEFKNIETFVIKEGAGDLDIDDILLVNDEIFNCEHCKIIQTEEIDQHIAILRIKSADLYFLKYTGSQGISLNGLVLNNKRIYLFAAGSTIKLVKGKPVYYSDVVSHFMADSDTAKISFNVENLEFVFPTGGIGLRDINLSEHQGRLVGIMGASGAGKTTLMNALSGITCPTSGKVLINGIDLHKEPDKLEGVIGYIPQDDLLIEELTVYQNLYYSAKLCFRDKSEKELESLVNQTLKSLGLFERKDLKVGSPLNKMISGGQRKRLNIALELIREPSVLFVDEPTSGLSSRDSENVMDLLRELTLKGKLIFVVIHQPSSDIYKMFDKMVILDTGGYLIYYGNPVETITHFKQADKQINSDVGECPVCGSINPELIFNIVEAKVVDEFGNYCDDRKVSPVKWEEIYRNEVEVKKYEDVNEQPPSSLKIPSWFNQFKIYLIRDSLSKVSNKQYIYLNLLEAPLLGFILSYLIRYIADPNSDIYVFKDNENFPRYIFMAIVVSLFLGLTVSAEEIFKDRKILKRENFLNLSRSSYLFSKVVILTFISAVQAFLFTIVGNSILGVPGMFFEYWFALFSTFLLANMIGLNVSQTFNSAVTIYILIPFILIPMMALGGAMFSFDKLNRTIGAVGQVPMIAEFMPSKWVYEALMVHQYKNNTLGKQFYEVERLESEADFKNVYYIPALKEKNEFLLEELAENEGTLPSNDAVENALLLLSNEIQVSMINAPKVVFDSLGVLSISRFNEETAVLVEEYLERLREHYSDVFENAFNTRESYVNYYMGLKDGYYNELRDRYFNESIKEIVKNIYEKNKIIEYEGRLIQQIDPVYLLPDETDFVGFRAHFFAPKKYFMGRYFETYGFNITVVWVFTLFFYVSLYFQWLALFLSGIDKFKQKIQPIGELITAKIQWKFRKKKTVVNA